MDSHTAGEPFRVVTGGVPPIPGASMVAKRRWATEHLDGLRRSLMWEPRGHADMYGCFLTEAVTPGADFGVLFMHNDGFSTMCGHGIIAMATVAVTTGMIPAADPETRMTIDTPAGAIVAFARLERGRVASVRFQNVPSYLAARDHSVEVAGLGTVRYDLAFGGAFYAYVDANSLGLILAPPRTRELIDAGMAIKRAVAAKQAIEHPYEPDLGFLYGTILIGPAEKVGHHSRNVCIFADGEVDRSPTGTGVSGRVAIHYARGEIGLNEPITIESILGTTFTAKVIGETDFGPHGAVLTEVEGAAAITGRNEFFLDPEDEIGGGFLLK
ncbi:MAG: proline racemase family protein [Gemmatimonadota bacterium]